ncbi:hypothetical protein B0T20DRAFT_200319 [Sordaria brevicollis]|uniref:AA14 family lytic polysaccharide monooxygenase n=2 Tax=Sordaria brevicollis TaxID=83679 RepID=LP14_SORBR|nr:hypothetical protein B0T20DRAFT_200319 [Sordaria brevicollis]
MLTTAILFTSLAGSAYAHVAAFAPGMFCRGGNNPAVNDQDTNIAVNPLYNLPFSQWWMQADRGCNLAPPPAGEYLNLPAGGAFTVELAVNQAFTTLSWGGSRTTAWPDGGNHPDDWHGPDVGEGCLSDNPGGEGGALHTHNETTAAGTAWAISYEADIANVRLDNLVVFTTLEHTPFRRLATYQVPKDLPPCPPGGCYCAWLWVPKGCGEPNMYMQNYKCQVTGSTSTKRVSTPKPPVYCGDDSSKCVKGAKQMIAWHQLDGNNIVTAPGVFPGYNPTTGYTVGAQNDIFQ